MFVSDLTLKRKGRALRGVYISYVCSVRKIRLMSSTDIKEDYKKY